jgi:uncharacterized protein YjbJ (UPF0337 family)
MKNKADEAKGAAKEHVGKATDNEQMENEGKTEKGVSNLNSSRPARRSKTHSRSTDRRHPDDGSPYRPRARIERAHHELVSDP